MRVALLGVPAVAWTYLLLGAGMTVEPMDMGGGAMMAMHPAWSPGYAALVLLLWVVMMAAMMLPSVVPVLRGPLIRDDAGFAIGYLMVWSGFGVAATLVQWALDSADLLSERMALRSSAGAAILILAAGLYQFAPLKRACLGRCRSSGGDGEGGWAAVRRGLRYGVSCLGCCAGLMALLFVGGVMNVAAMAFITSLVFAEKALPWGNRVAYLSAIGLVIWGGAALVLALG